MYCDAHGYQHQRPQQIMDSITKHFQGISNFPFTIAVRYLYLLGKD